MNGNFEVDKGRYPYGPVAIGNGWRVLHVPTQQQVLELELPVELASRVALRLNTQYHAWKAGGPKFDGSPVNTKRIVGQELTGLVQEGAVAGHVATQIQQRLDA